VTSGRDATLKGAQVSGGTVLFDVGGKLLIETLQDSSKYDSTQSSSGFSVSVCWFFCAGVPVTGSVGVSEQSIKHSYLSAVGQSGIAAGDGGFDIRVKGGTELVGAAITSSAAAGDNRLTTASLSSRDLQNAQSTQSSGSSLSVGYDGGSMLTTLAGNAAQNVMGNLQGNAALPKNGSQSGTTQSVISPATITITGIGDAAKDASSRQTAEQLTTRDAASANGSLTNTLTLQQAQALPDQLRRQQENMEAAKLIGAVLSNVVGDVAAKQGWKEGGPEKIALHGMVGLIEAQIGGGSAAAGALAGMTHEALVPAMTTYLNSLGFDDTTPAKKLEFDALMNAGSSLLGAAVGALASGDVKGASTGASVALIADINNRALHQDRKLQVARAVAAKTGEKVDTDQIKSRMLFDGEAAALVDGGTYNAMFFNPELIAAGASTGAADSVALASAFKGDVGNNGAVFVASPQDSPAVRYQTAVQFLGPYFETWLNAPGNEANKDSFTARIVDTPSGLVNLTDFYHVAEAISIEKKSQQAGFSGGATTFFDKLGQGVSNMFNFAAKYREATILNACTECPQSMQDKPNNLLFAADLLLTANILKDVAVLGGRGVLALKGANSVDAAAAGSLISETSSIARNGSRLVFDQRYVSDVGSVACGPTACAMVLNDSGKWVNVTQIARDAGLVPGVGTDVVGLSKTLQNNGLSSATWILKASVDDLAVATSKGNAAIARVTLENGEGHFVVVDGVTVRQGQSVVAIRDPGTGKQYFVPSQEFANKFSGQAVLTR